MLKKLFYFVPLYLFLLLTISVNAAENDKIVTVNVFNNIYYGTLEEKDENTSVFSAYADQSDSTFTITGKWSDTLNAFDGACNISYQDGTTQAVTYKDGAISKQVVTTFPDGSYQTFSAKAGKPYKKIFTYSEDGSLLDLDWFYQCRSVKGLNQSAISLDYQELIRTPYDYNDVPIKVSGTVVALYEIPTHGYIKIKDENNHMYLFNYPNASIQSFTTTNVENVSIGDSIEIYGFFDSINDYKNNPLSLYEHTLGYEMSFDAFQETLADSDFLAYIRSFNQIDDADLKRKIPVFAAYYWTTDKTDIDPLHLTFDYEDICKYPYYYKNEKISLTGKVVYEDISASENHAVLLIQKENSSEIYGVHYNSKNYMSLLNKTVSCSGSGDGNCKIPYYNSESTIMGYALFPNIKASSVKPVSDQTKGTPKK